MFLYILCRYALPLPSFRSFVRVLFSRNIFICFFFFSSIHSCLLGAFSPPRKTFHILFYLYVSLVIYNNFIFKRIIVIIVISGAFFVPIKFRLYSLSTVYGGWSLKGKLKVVVSERLSARAREVTARRKWMPFFFSLSAFFPFFRVEILNTKMIICKRVFIARPEYIVKCPKPVENNIQCSYFATWWNVIYMEKKTNEEEEEKNRNSFLIRPSFYTEIRNIEPIFSMCVCVCSRCTVQC